MNSEKKFDFSFFMGDMNYRIENIPNLDFLIKNKKYEVSYLIKELYIYD